MSKIAAKSVIIIIFVGFLLLASGDAIGCPCDPPCGPCQTCRDGVCEDYGDCKTAGDCGPCYGCSSCYCGYLCDTSPCVYCVNGSCQEKQCGSCKRCSGGNCVSLCGTCEECTDDECTRTACPPPCTDRCCEDTGGGGGGGPGGGFPGPGGGPGGGWGGVGSAAGGDPVFIKKGEYRLYVTDLSIQGRGLNVEIVRTYGSQRIHNLVFGHGWDINYNKKVYRLDVDEGDPNIVVLTDGKSCSYEYTQDDSDPNLYLNTNWPGQYFYLDDVNDTFTLAKKESEDYGFDANDNLASITDEYGNSITFDYDANGLLTTITDTLNRDITLSYDSNDMLESITDFAARSWEYIYDSNDLVGVTGPNTTDYPNGLTTAYYYDEEHNLTYIIDPNEDEIVRNYYEEPDRVWKQDVGEGSYEFDYDPDNNLTEITDREGIETRMVYNSTGQLISETVYTANPDSEPNSFTISYVYDPNLLRIRTIYPEGNCIDYTYDSIGNITGIYRKTEPGDANSGSDPNVTATLFTYDVNFVHKVKTITDARGNVGTYDYNDITGVLEKITYPTAGSQTPVESYKYNSFGQVTEVNGVDGIITKYEYYSDANDANNYGHLWKVIVDYGTGGDYLNITTELEYDILGNVKEVNDPNGDTRQTAYNNLDQLTKITTPSPYNYVTRFSYDKNGNQTKVEAEVTGDPNQIISYSYNVMKKIESMTDPLGNITTYGYNKNDEPNLVTDAEDNDTIHEYNERGLLNKVIDANGGETKYGYNDNGYLADINDSNGDLTSYAYDGFDRLIRITYPDDTNEAFGYDKNSNVTSRKNRKGDIIYYEYDALNRMTVKNRPGDPNIYYGYDIAGRVVSVNDDGDITTYSYDRIGRVEEVNDVESRVVKYEYNDSGRRTKLTYPDNSYITYEYDAMGRLTIIKDDSSNVLAQYAYDELSRRILLTLGNGTTAEYEYDLADRLKKLTNNIDDDNSIVFDYANYDTVGNRLSMKVDDTNAHVYTYDCLYQLTNVDYNDGSETDYYYDSLGNRTSVVNDGTTIYDSNCLNQYTSVGGLNYLYDKNGNLADINDGEYEYVYDCENRLIEAKKNSQTVAAYSYDYEGRRISKTVGQTTIKYCYDGDQVIAEYNGSTLARKFVYGQGIDELVCMIAVAGESETLYYYHFDGLGSVAALSDVNSGIVERYSYDVFGEPNRVSGVNNPYMFTGRRYDIETRLYYYRARYYKTDIGRFLQTDPIRYAAGLNMYTYVGNNPIKFVDPFGEMPSWLRWRDIKDEKSCIKYCKDTRNEHLDTAKWAYDLAKKAALKILNKCLKACDDLFPPGECWEKDPLDRNNSCKAICEAAYGSSMVAAYVTYEATLGVVWGQYGACYGTCKILY